MENGIGYLMNVVSIYLNKDQTTFSPPVLPGYKAIVVKYSTSFEIVDKMLSLS